MSQFNRQRSSNNGNGRCLHVLFALSYLQAKAQKRLCSSYVPPDPQILRPATSMPKVAAWPLYNASVNQRLLSCTLLAGHTIRLAWLASAGQAFLLLSRGHWQLILWKKIMNDKISGLYNDDGSKINQALVAKPDLCVTCKKDDLAGEEELLCVLNRNAQKNTKIFECRAYESKF